MKDLNCKTASSSDADDVIGIWIAAGLTRPWNDPKRDFDFALNGPASTVLTAWLAGAMVGAVMVGHDGHRGAVYYLGVDPNCQKAGVGRFLMETAENWLREQGVWKLNLLVRQTNSEAIGFYERLGYADQQCIAFGRRLDGFADRKPPDE